MFIQHQLIPSIRTSTHPIELKLVKVLLEKSKLFGLASNSANFVYKKTNKKDKNTIKTNKTAFSPTSLFLERFLEVSQTSQQTYRPKKLFLAF